MKYDAIIFDFDGVIAESINIKTQAFAELYREHGPDIVEKVVQYHEKNAGVSRYAKIRYYQEELLGITCDESQEEALALRFSRLVEDAVSHADEVPGANEFIKMQAKTLPLFIASATPQEELIRIVHNRKIASYFTGIFGAPRTKTEIIASILKSQSLEPERVLMIGDAIADYQAAEINQVDFAARLTDHNKNIFPTYNYGFKTFKEFNIDR